MKLNVPYTVNIFADEDSVYICEKKVTDRYLDMSLFWWSDDKEVPVETIIAITKLNIKLPVRYLGKVKVEFIDGNSDNLYYKNLYYKFPIGKFECLDFPGYYYIPYFTSCVINKDGEVISLNAKKKIRICDNKGYNFCSLTKDVHVRKNGDFVYNISYTTGRYRLLALTFLDYSENPFNLVINHKDGNPQNDNLDNIEWCTYAHNNQHAYANGLKTDNKPVLVKDYFTGNVWECFSQGDAERQTGVLCDTISYNLVNGSMKAINGRYSFKFKDDPRPWQYKTLQEATSEVRSFIVVNNIFTGEINEALGTRNVLPLIDNATSASMIHQVLSYQKNNLDKDMYRPYCGYFFKDKWDNRSFPKLTKAELILYGKTSKRGNRRIESGAYPIVILKNGELFDVAVDSDQASEITGMGKNRILWMANNWDDIYSFYLDENGDKISFVKLYVDSISLKLNYMSGSIVMYY